MALVLQDRVRVNSTGYGTGNLALASAYSGYRTFSSCVPDGSLVYYTIVNQSIGYDNEWEVGYGKYDLGTNTLIRNNGNAAETGVYSSSNSNAYVNFTIGTNGLDVFITQPAEQAVYQDVNNTTTFKEGVISVVGANATAPTFPATLSSFVSNEPSYSQLVLQNQSNDANASSDVVAYNNLGDGTSYFIDMGIDSSTYNSGDYPILQANDGYLFTGGNIAGTGTAGDISRLMLGTSTANSNVVIFAGSVNTGSEVATFIASNKNVSFSNSISVTSNVSANNVNVTNFVYSGANISNAANNTVLVTQAYVDNAVAAGLDIHDPVNLSTAGALTGSPTYNQPGGAGVGVNATLTASGPGFLNVDGKNAAFGYRILVQSQANAVQNGVYTVTTEGDGSTAYVLTRATDSDTSTELSQGSYYYTLDGDTLKGDAFVVNTVGTITFGSTDITFALFSSPTVYTGTSPINVTNTVISLNTVPTANGGTNLTTYTTGDLIYANASNTLTQRAIGATNTVLVSNGTTPNWGTVALGSSNAVSGTLGATNGGTGQSTYTLGDIIYSNGSNTLAKLPGQTTTTKKYLQQQGDGVNSAAPSWQQIANSDISGLGTMSTQNANSVTITGGTLDNVVIGGTTTANGSFTNVSATNVSATNGAFTNVSGNGSALTAINASNISSGTIANARTTAATANGASTIVLRDTAGNFAAGTISASFSGDGSAITGINASSISSGTIANARTTAASANGASTIVQRDSGGNFSANTITANISGDISGGTNINASNITSGTLSNARTTASSSNGASTIVVRDAGGAFAAGAITGAYFIGDGSNVSAINASNISSGTISNARTTAASANGASTIVARDAGGNFTAATITATTFSGAHTGDGSGLSSINASNISSGTISNARTTAASANGASTIVARDAGGNFAAATITATTFSGSGASLTSIPNSALTNSSVTVSAGTGLTGGGAVSLGSSTTLSLANTTVSAGSYTYSSITVDAQGRLTAASSGAAPSAFPAGTLMLFQQTAAPTGWTKQTVQNDKALRVVSGTASTGGSVAFSTAFASQAVSGTVSTSITGISGSAGNYTLTTTDIPSHNHGNYSGGGCGGHPGGGAPNPEGCVAIGYTGGGGAHSHAFSFSSGTASSSFSGTAINLAVQYVDVIIASKD